jgi:hypothetical protein
MSAQFTIQILTGHTSADTAYVVDDYPYGFRLRCQMRHWIETKSGFGQRHVTQTSNPKRPGTWNKPKASTYSSIVVLYIGEDGYVHSGGVHMWTDDAILDTFETEYAEALTGNYEREALRLLRAANRASKRLTYTICTQAGIDGPVHHDPKCNGTCGKSMKEQGQILSAVIRDELWKDTLGAIHSESTD